MTRALFKGQEVITSQTGQCGECRERVHRVLIAEGTGRQWYAAEPDYYGFVPHNCKPSGGSPAKKAA